MGGALFAVERARVRLTIPHDAVGDRPARIREQRLDGGNRLSQCPDQFVVVG